MAHTDHELDILSRWAEAGVETIPERQLPENSILLVDYEQDTCQCLGHILTAAGQSVMMCGDAIEAIEYYRLHYANIALVIIDALMPDMNGSDVLLAMKSINPQVKAVVISDMASDEIAIDKLVGEKVEFVRKPFAISD